MEKVQLKDLTDIYLGVTHTPEYVWDGVPFLSVKDISGGDIVFDDCKYISEKEYESLPEGAKPKVGDMLFCRVGTIGKPIIIPEGTPKFGSFVSLGYLRNKDASRCKLEYLKHWMSSKSFYKQVQSNVKGASQVNLNTGWLTKFEVPLPKYDEQCQIVRVLNKCKEILDKRNAELNDMDELIKARFVELSNKWNASELPLSDFLDDITYGFTNPMPDSNVGPWKITAKDVVNGHINFEAARKTTQEAYDSLTEKSKPIIGDVLLTKDGTLGRTAIVEDEKICVNQSVAVLRCNNKVLPRFLALLLQLPEYQAEMTKNSGGGTIKHIYITKVDKMLVKIPDINSQKELISFVEQVDKSKVAVKKALDETQTLFDSLMQEYFG